MSEERINRQVVFIHAPAFDIGDTSGINNTWIYIRAPDGYLFLLDSVDVSGTKVDSQWDGIFNIVDGHEYTHWNIFPGVECRELLGRVEVISYNVTSTIQLHNWECKEYTIAIRGTNANYSFKVCAIVWYRLVKASREKLLEYALKHPFNPDAFKRALRGATLTPGEE